MIWFLIGAAFFLAEIGMPGFVLGFFAAGSWITALAVWLTDIGLAAQVVLFLASSLVLLFSLRKWSLEVFHGGTVESLDDDYANSKIGKRGVVTKEISPALDGEVKLMGSFWRAAADSVIEEGAPVEVTGQASPDGLTLKVRRIETI